ncbi:hypothetical protein SISSUDRAFT_1097490 [Sistotremastrum suecicum HHB10207 ss-3]|uniref:Uncharacterized protein n=1 Tax=Sistotremastrum suecicum HHB10207 ss-3 TaxID=1314776 RepID=A0A165X9J7_9AGAM|nr:hypothetical protein SISSUDRAFT_1097490 [Sistotremastrum suecicum HHB10207 ss-3]
MPKILPSKSRIPKDSVSILINSLKILEGIGEAIPVGGGTVKAIAKIGIALLEVGEKARVARSECLDLLEKTVNQILLIKPHLVAREPMSDDLQERLERYHDALNDAVQPLEQLCVKSKAKMPFTSTRIQEEVDDLRDKLNDAYQTFIFHSWISVDSKMTEVLRGMNALSISHNTQIVSRPGEADEV